MDTLQTVILAIIALSVIFSMIAVILIIGFSALLTMIIAFLSIMLPGFFLSLALLKKTKLNMFEITTIGFIFGLIFPPALTWFESYFMNYVHAFTFSAGLYEANVAFLTVLGLLLSFQQGAIPVGVFTSMTESAAVAEANKNYKERLASLRSKLSELNVNTDLIRKHQREEEELLRRHAEERNRSKSLPQEERNRLENMHEEEERRLINAHEKEERVLLSGTHEKTSGISPVWYVLLFLMVFSFGTRMLSIGIAPHFFEFDPYFDMQSTEFILTHGYQWLWDHSSWPVSYNFTTHMFFLNNGTPHRIEPIVPYLEAFWYQISNPPASQINQTLLANASSFYPPITAALLVFVVFIFLYHAYGEHSALLGAVLATSMLALITTFIAGEQLVEPWGIFAMFFFYAAYLLAVQNPKELRFAILAGIAFAASFLGAHYYTVIAGVFAIYIALQGIVDVLRKKGELNDFYKMNGVIIGIIAIFYLIFNPYNTVLTNKIPSVFGIPVIVSFPLLSLVFVALLDYVPKLVKKHEKVSKTDTLMLQLAWLVVLGLIAIALIFFTPLGKSIKGYLELSSHYTTPSIPLFMTVQEYEPTGFNFNFGSAGFGPIGASFLFGTGASAVSVNAIVWFVLIIFTLLALYSVFVRDDKGSILALAAIWPLAIAGMVEIKYMPHFGVGYIIALCAIIGELLLLVDQKGKGLGPLRLQMAALCGVVFVGVIIMAVSWLVGAIIFLIGAVLAFYITLKPDMQKLDGYSLLGLVVILIIATMIAASESAVFINLFSSAGTSCQTINQQGNSAAFDLYCNTVPHYWITALNWMKQNVGPLAPRVLSWWDYGDWINWFGNSNAVLRGDNSIALLDYATAARYVLGYHDGYGPANLANFSNNVVYAKYVLFDDQITAKWQALNFLACVHVNQTSRQFAIDQAKASGAGVPYVLGTSKCETDHQPAYLLVPYGTSTINSFCQLPNGNVSAVRTLLLANNQFSNQTYCAPSLNSTTGAIRLLNSNGTKTNIVLSPVSQLFAGLNNVNGQLYLTFIALYMPNGPNDTITNAPTQFYNSNYYRGFYLGKLPGFTIAYPSNFTGVNYVNGTWPVVVYQLNNYTGPSPYVTPKPAWVQNNFTMPG